MPQAKKIEILAQIPVFAEGDTVEDVLRSSFAEVTEVYTAMKKIEGNPAPEVLLKYGKLLEEYERLGGYDVDFKLEKICNGMNITDEMRTSPFALLSGGEKTRVNLARILLRDCDILLLDEPTNHLDLASLAWFEQFLHEYRGTAVIISHDRVFLDNVVSRIVEIADGTANFYTGNYTYYAEERERRFLAQAEQYKQQQRKIGQLEEAIKRQRVWADINPANTGLAKRALAMEKRIEQMDKVEKPTTARKLTEDFDRGGYTAKELVSFEDVCKSYTKSLLNNVTISILRNDRIALIGENGCGKTTLIKLIMGQEPCDSGIVKVSSNVKIAYMPQIITFENETATVLDTLRHTFDLTEEKARAILASFNFRATDVIKKVGTLSGGEKSRLKLCLLMQEKINFLILDEPTNHLDIDSRRWIEAAVEDWAGTMLFISHDRYFLNKFASRIWAMKDGAITDFHGSFDEYAATPAPVPAAPKKETKKSSDTKFVSDDLKRSPSTEEQILAAEAELAALNARIEKALSDSAYQEMEGLYRDKHQLEEKLENLYNNWV